MIIPTSSKPSTPVKTRSVNSTPSKVEAKSGLRLVSYHDDTVISDDENDDDSPNRDIEMETSDRESETEANGNNENEEPTNELKRDRVAEYGFALPPEPKGKCPQDLQDKITNMYGKMRTNNMDMNKLIQERKEFRNPSIYEKLIQYCDIDELGTNYPPELYDPMQWTSELTPIDCEIFIICTAQIKSKINQIYLFFTQIKNHFTKNWLKYKKLRWINEKKISVKMK